MPSDDTIGIGRFDGQSKEGLVVMMPLPIKKSREFVAAFLMLQWALAYFFH